MIKQIQEYQNIIIQKEEEIDILTNNIKNGSMKSKNMNQMFFKFFKERSDSTDLEPLSSSDQKDRSISNLGSNEDDINSKYNNIFGKYDDLFINFL